MIRSYPARNNFLTILLCLFSLSASAQLQCDNDTTGMKSLIDLKFGYYLGYQGGLYPNGFNMMPFTHYSGGMNASRRVLPRNADGEVDWENGEVVFISMGASTAGNAFNHFKTVAQDDITVNQCLRIVNCTVGAKGIEVMNDTTAMEWYWDDYIFPDLDSANVTAKQVQVVWIMVTSRVDTILYWPYQPRQVTDRYEVLMGVLLNKFPNLQMVFVSGFPYGGYADPTKEFYEMIQEPTSYWNNWSVKWLVERQIDNDPDLKYTEPERRSPWIGWGPHLWADGLRANVTDGLSWNCYVDFKPDGGGYHLSNEGKEKEGNILFDFFYDSPLAANWFKHNTRWESCDSVFKQRPNSLSAFDVNIYPNPTDGICFLEVLNPPPDLADLIVINSLGETVYRKNISVHSDYYFDQLDLSSLPGGLYNFIFQSETQAWERSLLVQH